MGSGRHTKREGLNMGMEGDEMFNGHKVAFNF